MTIPLHPPRSWFDKPAEGIPTDRRITITPEGRVYGYVKLRGSCHIGMPGCVDAPDDSPSGFAYVHKEGATLTAEGEEIATANIAGGRHAGQSADIVQAAAHYHEGMGNQLMRVRYGSDENGIYFSGALWPDVDPVTIEHIRASALSGDWRYVNHYRGHDFAGSVLVNIPGFPMHRSERVDEGMLALAASMGQGVSSIDDMGNLTTVEKEEKMEDCGCDKTITADAAEESPAPTPALTEAMQKIIASQSTAGLPPVSWDEASSKMIVSLGEKVASLESELADVRARRMADELSAEIE